MDCKNSRFEARGLFQDDDDASLLLSSLAFVPSCSRVSAPAEEKRSKYNKRKQGAILVKLRFVMYVGILRLLVAILFFPIIMKEMSTTT